MSVAISARGVVKGYHDGLRWLEVLRGVDLEVEAGELVAIVGPSGSGKSTLLHLLGVLDRPTGGRIQIGGIDPVALSRSQAAAFRNRTIGFVFQFHQLLPDFTALENVMMPGRIARRDPTETLRRARSLLEEVGLGDRLDHTPGQLSGGECQRVALCRALALEPPLLLADEPTGNLDPDNGRVVFDLLLDLVQRRGSTAVVVTHNPELAGRCARLFELDHGVLRTAVEA